MKFNMRLISSIALLVSVQSCSSSDVAERKGSTAKGGAESGRTSADGSKKDRDQSDSDADAAGADSCLAGEKRMGCDSATSGSAVKKEANSANSGNTDESVTNEVVDEEVASTPMDTNQTKPDSTTETMTTTTGTTTGMQAAGPSVQVAIDKTALSVVQNSSQVAKLTVTPQGGFTGEVGIALPTTGLPAGVTLQLKSSTGTVITTGKITVGATPVTADIVAVHAATVADGVMTLTAAVTPMAAPIKASLNGVEFASLPLTVGVAASGLVPTVDPANNGGKMFNITRVNLPIGVGVCLLNTYRTSLRFHGNPHQGAGGMPVGSCYDKYAGTALTAANAATAKGCAAAGMDTLYNHDTGAANGGSIQVACQ